MSYPSRPLPHHCSLHRALIHCFNFSESLDLGRLPADHEKGVQRADRCICLEKRDLDLRDSFEKKCGLAE